MPSPLNVLLQSKTISYILTSAVTSIANLREKWKVDSKKGKLMKNQNAGSSMTLQNSGTGLLCRPAS